MSRVVHRQSFNSTRADAHRWAEIHDLMRLYRKGCPPVAAPEDLDEVSLRVAAGYGIQLEPHMQNLLQDEASRLNLADVDAAMLAEVAAPMIRWAEHYAKTADDLTIARFAAESTYDNLHRMAINSTITQVWPRKWWVTRRHHGLNSLHHEGHEEGQRLAFSGERVLDIVRRETDEFIVGKVPAVNQVTPYVNKALPKTWGWVLDPGRPLIAAVRLSASIIEQEVLPRIEAKVLAIELGLTAAAQALAWFLPSTQVHTASGLLGDTDAELPTCDAVVVNLPSARAMSLVHEAQRLNRAFNRWEVGQLHDLPAHDPGHHCAPLVQTALDRLGRDGVLVLMGDIECGIHHHAAAIINADSSMQAIPLTPSGKPVAFRYVEEPWTLFGCLPATDRFVSAWRRRP